MATNKYLEELELERKKRRWILPPYYVSDFEGQGRERRELKEKNTLGMHTSRNLHLIPVASCFEPNT
jgi:hypothetical protein